MSFGAERVFISYRRSDAEAIARSLYEALKARFGAGRVFFDTSSIPFGEDFRRVVEERIAHSAVVVVVIGPGWFDAAHDAHVVRDGFVRRSVFGVQLQADAIATLASGPVPCLQTADEQLVTTLAAAGAGAGTRSRRAR
jgi:hypothetical protein